jgi:3'(2'), 5'-bisphosphate nucleotidase
MIDLDFVAGLAREAGRAILEVYGTDFEVKRKDDCSPLTIADTRSHRIIADSLRSRYPEIPVLSEALGQVLACRSP